jgi:DNA recombination protein RmuC
MEIISLIISAATLLLVIVILARKNSGSRAEDIIRLEGSLAALRQELGNSLQQNSISISGLVTRSGADMRQEVSDRLSHGFSEMREKLDLQLAQGRQESGKSLEAIRSKVDERLGIIGQQVQAKLDENIKEGFAHFEKVQEHLLKAEAQLINVSAVGTSINELNSLLKLPHLRGGFGEAALEVLISEFLPPALYELQAQVAPGSAERVDLLIKLPGANLPVDSKFPREQVLPLFEQCGTAELAEARKALSRVVKEQAKDIAAKYIRPEHGTTDMALMFLPSETLYFEVVRDGELWGFLQKVRVYPVSPNTLAVTLKGITLSFDYYRMAKGVEKTIENIKKARKHFGYFHEKFDAVGKGLENAQKAYSAANTHLGRYSSSVLRLTGEEADDQDDAPPSIPDLPL